MGWMLVINRGIDMKIILWNIGWGGGDTDEFIPRAWEIIYKHHLTIFIFLETKSDDVRARKVLLRLGFQKSKCVHLHGRREKVDLVLFNEGNDDFFHALFHFSPNQSKILLIGVHAPSERPTRRAFWRNLQSELPPSYHLQRHN
ncbi:Immunoglobulin superfamily member 6 [Bienertia sinuspersici]